MTIRLRTLGQLTVLLDGSERPEMRTRPVGGWTLKCTFLMSFSVTSTIMSPSLSCSLINIRSVL